MVDSHIQNADIPLRNFAGAGINREKLNSGEGFGLAVRPPWWSFDKTCFLSEKTPVFFSREGRRMTDKRRQWMLK